MTDSKKQLGLQRLNLEPHEVRTDLWKKIEQYFTERLEIHRAKNDQDKSDIQTAKLRGQIAECKHILSLGQPDQRTGGTSDGGESSSDW